MSLSSLTQALRSEFYVARYALGARLLIFIPSAAAAVQFMASKIADTGTAARDGLMNSVSFDDVTASNAWGHFVDGLDTGITLLFLLLVAQAAYSFSAEVENGTMRHQLIRCSSRRLIVMSKLLQLHALALMGVGILIVSSYLLSGLLWEFGPVVEDGFELISEAEIRDEITLGLRLALTPLPAAIALGLLLSVLANTATQAVVSALGITLAMDIFKGMLGDYAYYLYASFQPALIDQSYLQDVSRLVRGYSDVLIDDRVIQLNYWVPIPTLLVLVTASLIFVQTRKL
ncbi:MAG: ABC transporter permease subunit [Gammaproteobacteria bacterium]|nr:ABC transporter permease subunit [Gammaproteobacteria bacterium]